MPPMTEASEAIFMDQVIRLAKTQGWLIFHASPKMVRPGVWRSDGRGFPDLVLVHKSRGLIFAELKTDSVILEGDTSANLGKAIELMDMAKVAGAKNFSISAEEGKKN